MVLHRPFEPARLTRHKRQIVIDSAPFSVSKHRRSDRTISNGTYLLFDSPTSACPDTRHSRGHGPASGGGTARLVESVVRQDEWLGRDHLDSAADLRILFRVEDMG